MSEILARLFDSFKAKNPKLAAVILLVLGVIQYVLVSGEFAELFGTPDWLNTVLIGINFILVALQGSRTSEILANRGK